MPKWGLTQDQQRSSPWGIPEVWLRPAKTITDPVHGDIYINELERRFLDSAPLQRLRRVRQLGATHLVYPGATHSRLSHSLGAVRSAQDLLDAVIANRSGPHRHSPDLFDEWPEEDYDHKLAEVTVLARLGALLHDMCHVPFGHSVEDDLRILRAHDENNRRFETLWGQLPDDLRSMLAEADDTFRLDLLCLILSKDKDGKSHPPGTYRYPFVADIVGNTICADLLDYLARDHLFAGLPVAFGDRFADDFFVSPTSDPYSPARMVVGITRDGHDRTDIITELLKYLRYRYELSERVLAHHGKLAADAMIGKLLELWHDAVWVDIAREGCPDLVATHGTDIGQLRKAVENAKGKKKVRKINARVERELERTFLRHGDDGLLEYLLEWSEDARKDGRRDGVHSLVSDVLNRRLFKPVGRADGEHERAHKEVLYERYGRNPQARRDLEQDAARFIGLAEKWQIVVWLPAPKMRLKVAGVLVARDGQISPLDQAGNERAREIYQAHEGLWAISVYAHESVKQDGDKVAAALAFLGTRLGVTFRTRDGEPVRSVLDLAVDRLADLKGLSHADALAVRGAVRKHARDDALDLAAHGGAASTFDDICEHVMQVAITDGVLPA